MAQTTWQDYLKLMRDLTAALETLTQVERDKNDAASQGDLPRVEECMNDIFFGIWKNIDCFDESRGSFVNWAAGVARLEAIDTLRRIQREHPAMSLEEMELEIPEEDTALRKLTEQELSKETEEILRCLSGKDQELFRRIFLMEEEPEEAGQALGMSRDNVYVRIFRGKKKIRSKFGERKRA